MTNDEERAGPRHQTIDDFLENAADFDEVDKVFDELEERASKEPVDEGQLRRQRDWSVLANQVVGAEAVDKPPDSE